MQCFYSLVKCHVCHRQHMWSVYLCTYTKGLFLLFKIGFFFNCFFIFLKTLSQKVSICICCVQIFKLFEQCMLVLLFYLFIYFIWSCTVVGIYIFFILCNVLLLHFQQKRGPWGQTAHLEKGCHHLLLEILRGKLLIPTLAKLWPLKAALCNFAHLHLCSNVSKRLWFTTF